MSTPSHTSQPMHSTRPGQTSRTSSTSGITYRLAPGTPLSVTVATAYHALTRETETSGPQPLERLAAAFYDDLHTIARKTAIPLWQALAAPDTYAEQPDLLARLVSADVEQLLRDQLIAGVALVLSSCVGSDESNVPIVRYCATYLLRRVVSPLPDEPVPPPYVRAAERFDPDRHAGPDTDLELLVAWYPAVSTDERATTITVPRYQFQWAPLTAVAFDGTAYHTLTRKPDVPHITASGTEWTCTRLDSDSSRRL